MSDTSGQPARKTVLCFEWARGIAAAMVVLLHVTQGLMAIYPVEAVGQARATAWTLTQLVLTRWAVPVFLMISGALLLNPAKRVGWKDVWRYERRVILVLATFGYLFCLMEQYAGTRQVSLGLFGVSLVNLLSAQSWDHMWYLYALMGIYLLLPMMKAYVSQASREDLRIFLVVLGALTVGVPSLNHALGLDLATLVWLPACVFYFLLGHYAFIYMRLSRRLVIACVAGTALGCLAQAAYVAWGDYALWVRSVDSVFVIGLALLAFLLFKTYLERPFSPRGLVAKASSYSFGVYVLHPVFLNVAYKVLGIGPWSLPPVALELGMWAAAFFGSVAALWVMRRIPGVRRIL